MFHKYRAWIKAEKRMVDVQVIDFRDNFIICLDPLNVYRGYYFDDIVLMLGVEIKGKLVYTGDIVEAYWTDSSFRALGEIIFKDGAFRMVYKDYEGGELAGYEFYLLGNKFEHAHLLERNNADI